MSYIRFEDRLGNGLFWVMSEFRDQLESRNRRLDRKTSRVFDAQCYALCQACPPPRFRYSVTDVRFPRAWFKPEATTALRHAAAVVAIMNRQGLDIRRLASANPGDLLFEDDTQIVVRDSRDPGAPAFRLARRGRGGIPRGRGRRTIRHGQDRPHRPSV